MSLYRITIWLTVEGNEIPVPVSQLEASSMAGLFAQKLAEKGLTEDRGNYINPDIKVYYYSSGGEGIAAADLRFMAIGMRVNIVNNGMPDSQIFAKVRIAYVDTLLQYGIRSSREELINRVMEPQNWDARLTEAADTSRLRLSEGHFTYNDTPISESHRMGSLNMTQPGPVSPGQPTRQNQSNQQNNQGQQGNQGGLGQDNQQNNTSNVPIFLLIGGGLVVAGVIVWQVTKHYETKPNRSNSRLNSRISVRRNNTALARKNSR